MWVHALDTDPRCYRPLFSAETNQMTTHQPIFDEVRDGISDGSFSHGLNFRKTG